MRPPEARKFKPIVVRSIIRAFTSDETVQSAVDSDEVLSRMWAINTSQPRVNLNVAMDFTGNVNTFTSSYVDDDDSADVILVDSFNKALSDSDLGGRLDNISASVLLVFSPDSRINCTTTYSELINATVKNEGGYRDSLSIILPISICYLIIFITGVLGNVITCFVIAKNKTMHTATNYYLFNLAVSDFLVLILGEWKSKITESFANVRSQECFCVTLNAFLLVFFFLLALLGSLCFLSRRIILVSHLAVQIVDLFGTF